MADAPRESGFLPPEPAGPEPDLGDSGQDPTQQLPHTEQTQPYGQQPPQGYGQQPQQGWAPPPPQGYGPPPPQGYGPPQGHGPPPGHGYGPPQGQGPPPGWQQHPPGWQQQPGWQGHQQQTWPPQQPWQPHPAWAIGPKEPDNNPAVAGFALSLIGGGLLFFFAGLTTIVSLGLSIAGIIYSRKGRAMVDQGKTTKQRGLAQAGFIIGIVSTVLSLLATVFWILFFVLLATSDDFRRELEDGNRSTIAIALVKGVFALFS